MQPCRGYSSPTGRLVFHVLGAIDEFQREPIIEGTCEGLDVTCARGRAGGTQAQAERPAGSRSPSRSADLQLLTAVSPYCRIPGPDQVNAKGAMGGGGSGRRYFQCKANDQLRLAVLVGVSVR